MNHTETNQVLDALKFAYSDCESDFVRDQKIDPAISICEASLARVVEPVPFGWYLPNTGGFILDSQIEDSRKHASSAWKPLYATPQEAAAQPNQAVEWIPVCERLPEADSGEVLVWLTGGRCAFDEWHQHHEDPTGLGGKTMYMGDMWRDYEFEEITHWMPLPTQPAEAA